MARNIKQVEDETVDMLVVGFGAAGACTAYQAMESAERMGTKLDILIVDRFEGGGATSRSGGVVYFGGGTDAQRKVGVQDDAENMYRYLKLETDNAVEDETLWRFCVSSRDSAAWLRDSFEMTINKPDESAVLCPFKTSNSPDPYSLFYSGSETCKPFTNEARAAPRGHKAIGPGTLVGTGNVLFAEMERAIIKARNRGIRVETLTKVVELLWDDAHSSVVGVKVATMKHAPIWARALYSALSTFGGLTSPFPESDMVVSKTLINLEDRYSSSRLIFAKRGVVLSTGGFGRNQRLVKKYIPVVAGCLPIGSAADDGHGIFELGEGQANAQTKYICNASAWKFIVPAASMAKGVLLCGDGERVINEDVYGARLAEYCLMKKHVTGSLIIDQTIYDECKKEFNTGDMLLFQKIFTLVNLDWNRIKADSLEELAKTLKMPELLRTIESYNKGCENGNDENFGKEPHLLSKICKGPFYAINFDPRASRLWPTPYFTLGGLAVDEKSGQVLNKSNQPIPGLFAAGRSAAGICSKSYVSGLSLADCIFSGRRTGFYLGSGGKIYEENVGHVPAASTNRVISLSARL